MLDSPRSKSLAIYVLCLLAMTLSFVPVKAQNGDEADPIKLFEKGQDAHAKGDLKRAIELYDAAIKLSPEFPEAEFQRAMALLLTNRKSDAIAGFNRAVTQRPDWGLAYAKFGSQLAFVGDADQEAEPLLRKAIQLDARNLE